MLDEINWATQAAFPILSTMIFLPLVAMGAAYFAQSQRQAFIIGLVGAGLELALTCYLLIAFDSNTARLQFAEHLTLLPFLHYHLGIDGLSVLFVFVTALLSFLLMLYGEITPPRRSPGLYVASLFGFQAVLTALFLTVDLLQFWLLACLELVPASFILRRWSTASANGPATRLYLQFMLSGLLMLFLGILTLAWNHVRASDDWSFALGALLETPASPSVQSAAFVLLFYGLAVRMAQFPFHAWLPQVSQHGTLATIGVFMVGAKVGIYGLLRFVLPLVPDAVQALKPAVVVLALGGMFYGALMALMQLNLRRLLAFAAVSHTGMLVVGVFCLNSEGLAGSLLLSVNFGIAASGLLFSAGLMFRRARSALLPRLGGLFDLMPLLGITFLVSALSTMAMPGTPGFDAAHLLLEGAIEAHDWGITIAVATGNVLAAAFLLWAFQRAFLAQRKEAVLQPQKTRLTVPEATLNGVVCAVLLGVGFYTDPWLKIVNESVSELAQRFEEKKH
ncbi:NADH-quinone oxidoreductase subunit M [Methylocaldum sp.]|uniref:complex I subunit 4 family protein n=1 Tax=Methylocaldum sp. TaxID=1969727 RepID=UPI002D6811EC|nr:NADH-quinone oxidoreductase subunit M [Methylocaldum sp.]HYE35283.1 NADH-quinone oxidoreductase subunit M [Methylocaldum sp.]